MKCNLKSLLAKKETTQKDLAKKLNLCSRSLNLLANNKRELVNLKDLKKICKELDCTLDQLFTL